MAPILHPGPTPSALPPALQGRILTPQDLRDHGLSEQRLRRTDLRRVTHGAHRERHGPVTAWSSLGYPEPPVPYPPEEAAVVVKRARAVASHLSALRLHGLPVPPWLRDDGRLHVSRPHRKGASVRCGVASHARTVPPEDVVLVHGIPVTSLERTWADLASLLPPRMIDPLVVAGDAAVKRPWSPEGRQEPRTTVVRLRAALDRAGRFKGVRAAREALELIRVGADSPRETDMRLAIVHAGLPEPELQLVLDPSLPVSPDADMGYRRWRLVLHYDGGHHDDPDQRQRDQWRNDGWARAGWAQIWAGLDDGRDDYQRVLTEIRAHRDSLRGREYAVE